MKSIGSMKEEERKIKAPLLNTLKDKIIENLEKKKNLISEDILNKKRQEKEEMTDMQEREKQLLDESKKAQEGGKMDTFDEYITMNVKRAQLLWTYKETMEKLNSMKNSYVTSVERIKELDVEFPQYKEDYKEKYMKARRDSGIPDEQNSFVEFLGVDINTEGDNFFT
jgi:hypothetical protein